MKKGIGVLFLLMVVVVSVHSQKKFKEDFNSLIKKNNLAKIEILLKDWEKSYPNDIELQIAYFNFFIRKSTKSKVSMGQRGNGEYAIYEHKNYDNIFYIKAIDALDKALKINPNRLDVHFGKCSFLKKNQYYEEMVDSISNILLHSKKNNNDWLWVDNVKMKSMGARVDEIIVGSLIDYINSMFNSFELNKVLIENVLTKMEAEFQENIVIINVKAQYYFENNEDEKAINYLKRALELSPNDCILISNIAQIYEINKDYKSALQYYKMLKEKNNNKYLGFAEERIKEMLVLIK